MQEFDNIIGEKLRNLDVEPSARLYSRIEESLSAMNRSVEPVARRPRILQLWSYAAAAAIVAVAVLFTWRDNDITTQIALPTVTVGNTTIAAVVPQLPTQPLQGGRRVTDILRQTQAPTTVTVVEPTLQSDSEVVTAGDIEDRLRKALNSTVAPHSRSVLANWWDEIWDEDNDNFIARTIRGSSASLYGANFGLLSGNTVKNSSSGALFGGRLSTPRSAALNSTFGDRTLSLADNLVEEQLIHRMPVTFGLSVSIPLLQDKLSLTGGVNYSYLQSVSKESNLLLAGESRMMRELHYVGLTGALTWTPWSNRYWNLYLSGGGTLEKAVYARITETVQYESGPSIAREKFAVKGIQPSLNASVGAMFNITPWLGLYVEPGIAYYFNTGQPVNYRTENPISFSLQVGLRFNWR